MSFIRESHNQHHVQLNSELTKERIILPQLNKSTFLELPSPLIKRSHLDDRNMSMHNESFHSI